MGEPGVLVLPEVAIEGRRPRGVPADPSVAPRARLSNRAAGLLKAADGGPPPPSAAGGFGTERTAQDEAEVAAAHAAPPPRTTTADSDARAAAAAAAAPTPSDAGGFATERTAQDEAEVAAAQAPPPTRTTGAEVDARRAPAAAEDGSGHAGGGEAPAPSGSGGFEAERTAQDEAEVAGAAAAPARGTIVDPRTGVVVTTGGPDPASIRTPDELVAAVRSANDAITVIAPEQPPLSTALAPTVGAARSRRGGGGAGGGGMVRMPPVDPIAIDPVPAATKAVAAALAVALPPMRLPALAEPPAGIPRPVLDVDRIPVLDSGELATAATDLATGKPKETGKTVTEKEKGRRAKAKAAATAPVQVAPQPEKPLDPPVLLDLHRPAPPPLPAFAAEHEKAQVARVLATIDATLDKRAEVTVQAIRDAAFGERMGTLLPELTNPYRDQIAQAQRAKLEELAKAAGLSVEELNTASKKRRTEIEEHRAHLVTEAELDANLAAEALTKEERKKRAAAETEALKKQAKRVQRLRLAMHSHDPALVDALVTERLAFLGDDVTAGVLTMDKADKRRKDLLTAYENAYVAAYRRADSTSQQAARAAAARAPADAPAAMPSAPVADWATTAGEQARTAFEGLRKATTAATEGLVVGLRTAAEGSRAALREWREKRLRRVAHAEHEGLREASDRETVQKQIDAAYEKAALASTKQQLMGEIAFVREAYLQKQQLARNEAVEANRAYTKEQLTAAETYLSAGKGDPLAGVAEMMAARQQKQEVGTRTPQLQQAVYDKVATATTKGEVSDLAAVFFDGGSGGLFGRVTKLWKAFEGPGTDESDVNEALTGPTGPSMALLNKAYEIVHKQSLQWRIKDEMSGSDYDQAAGLAGNDGSAGAAAARQQHARGVIADSDGIFSNDRRRALAAIQALPPGEADAVAKDPNTKLHLKIILAGDRYDYDQRRWVEDTRGQEQLEAILAVNRIAREPGQPRSPELRWAQARSDALEMDRYIRRGTGEAPDIDKLFERIRADVLADPEAQGWSAAEVDDEVRRRSRDMEVAYQERFGGEMPDKANAMRAAMASYMWGTNKQLATDLLDVNRAGERATRLQRTTEGTYTSDSEMNTELARTFNDALAEVRRAPAERKKVDDEMQRLLKEDGYGPEHRPSPRELTAYRKEAEHKVATRLAKVWFAEVDRTFGKRYAHLWGGDPSLALQEMVTDTTQFSGEDQALARLENGGGLTAAQSVQFGLAGWGLEKDEVMAGIGGRSTKQLERIGKEFTHNTGKDMTEELASETGGWQLIGKPHWQEKDTDLERDAFDFREALRGVATTPEEEKAFSDRRTAYEENVYFKDNPAEREMAVGAELADMRYEHARAAAAYTAYQSAVASGDAVAIANAEAGMRFARDSVDLAADNYRTAVDAYVERAAQIAAIAAAILVTIVTWGAAGPVVIGLMASVAGTAAAMATKADILGSAYSRTAVTNDFVVGVVDAVVTVLTARMGNVLLRLPKPVGTGKVLAASLKAIEAQRLAKPLLARVGVFAAEQVAQSAPSAVTGALLDRSTWKGDPVRNVAKAAGFASAVGIGVGGVMHGVTSYGPKVFGPALEQIRAWRGLSGAEISAERVMLRSTAESLARGEPLGDALAHRGTPRERLAAQREYLKKYPDKTPADFQAALREGTADAIAGQEAQRTLRRDLLKELLDGVPPAERQRLLDTEILVLSDAEFVAHTQGKPDSNAATLILHGEPVVVLREGRPPGALREEGMHVLQARDPANAAKIALLEEEQLARWKTTSLEGRVAAWHAKLDLELEVQAKTIADMDRRLAGATPERAASIGAQTDDARAAFQVLSERRRQLLDLDDAAMARIRSGQQAPPHFLADEPRLFNRSRGPIRLETEVTADGRIRARTEVDARGRPVSRTEVDPGTGSPTRRVEFDESGTEVARERFVDGVMRERVELDTAGAPRLEQKYDPQGRLIRQVQYVAPDRRVWIDYEAGSIKDWGEHQLGSNGRWRSAGTTNRDRGGVGELAFRLLRAETPPGVRRTFVDAQRAGVGAGLDAVIIDVMPDGSIRVALAEVKHYQGNVALAEFTAINANLRSNVDLLEARLNDLLAQGRWEALGLTRLELETALQHVRSGQLHIELHLSATASVTPRTVRKLQDRAQAALGPHARVEPTPRVFDVNEVIDSAEDLWIMIEQHRRGLVVGATPADQDLFARLATRATGADEQTVQAAAAVVTARTQGVRIEGRAVGGGDVVWEPQGRYLIDEHGPFVVVTPRSGPGGQFDADAAARSVLDAAGVAVQPPGSATASPMRVLVDGIALTPREQEALLDALRRHLHDHPRGGALPIAGVNLRLGAEAAR